MRTTQQLTDLPDLATIAEVAAWLGCSTGTVRKMVRRGELRRIKVGRLDRIPKLSLERLRDGESTDPGCHVRAV